jgi:hypothetical protein
MVITVLACLMASPAIAQEFARPTTITALAGPMNFDLSGTGTTLGTSVRVTQALTPHVAVETGLLFARPVLQDGNRATLFTPEVHLQYHWRLGNVAPYAGGGVGFTHRSREGFGVTNLALSTAGGARYYVNDATAIVGEFRLRGVHHDFAGSTAEWLGGVSFSFGG